MTIRYQNTFRDIMAFCFYHSLRLPLFIGYKVVGFALISLILFHTVFRYDQKITTLQPKSLCLPSWRLWCFPALLPCS